MDSWGNKEDYDIDGSSGETSSSHKNVFISIAVIVGLIILSIVIAVIFTRVIDRQETKQAQDPSTRIDVPGYVNVPENIGDPAALAQRETKSPVTYQGLPVVDACDMLSLNSIRKQGLLVAPSADAGIMNRNFFDGTSEAVEVSWQKAESPVEELNDCSYVLVDAEGKRGGSLHIEVYQPTYASNDALRSRLDDYLLQGDILGGVDIYNRVNTPIQDTRTFYFLEKEQTYIGVEFSLGEQDDEGLRQTLLQSMAERLASALESPRGPAVYNYESSTFSGSYTSACAISSASDILQLFSTPASPSLQERIATATGTTEYGTERSNFISNQCIRRTSGEDRSQANTLTIETLSYESEEAAKRFIAERRNDPTISTAKSIGAESFFATAGSAENTFFFRNSSTVVSLKIYEPSAESMDSSQRAERLVPVAEKLLERMNGNYTVYEQVVNSEGSPRSAAQSE